MTTYKKQITLSPINIKYNACFLQWTDIQKKQYPASYFPHDNKPDFLGIEHFFTTSGLGILERKSLQKRHSWLQMHILDWLLEIWYSELLQIQPTFIHTPDLGCNTCLFLASKVKEESSSVNLKSFYFHYYWHKVRIFDINIKNRCQCHCSKIDQRNKPQVI